jgi:hypothetical protein
MAFGKRQSGVGSAAQALNVNTAAAQGHAVTESAAPTGHPIRWLIVLLACGAMLYGLVVSYGPDILRDHRLAGTWQPAYDLQAMEGKCERKNFVITFCSAKIRSVANPSQAPIAHRFMMLFAGGGGESLVPVRSTTDRTAVSIFYAAETKLWNRTLSFIFSAGILALFSVGALLVFWRALNHFDE